MAQINQDNNPVILDVDVESDDARSEVGSSIASSSTSLRSSILDYRFENGRTYHRYKDGKYNIPNDKREMDRLDLQHYLWLLVLDDRLGVAPPCRPETKVGRVLDVGTGSGIWAVNFGDEHPESEVLAMDLSATFPDLAPPNVTFEVDDLEEEWTYSRPFDYIHSRFMTGSVNDWEVYLRKCYDNLTPGGWVELQEGDIFPRSDDGTLKPEHPLMRYCQLLLEASEIFGRPYVPIPPLKELLAEIGFVDVSLSIYKWPNSPWAKDPKYKELGEIQGQNMAEGLEAFCMAPLTRAHNWTPEEVNVFLVDVRNNIKDRRIHGYWPVYCLIGRKPEKEPTPAPPAPSSPLTTATGQPQSPAKSPAAHDDARSEVGSSIASSRTSIRDSILDYRMENGRTYHRYKDSKYTIPNDEREMERLDLQHELWLVSLDFAPGIAPPCKDDAEVNRVLDVGTGTGIWAINYADGHPEAEVIGMDLSPTLPDYVPPNVRFEIDDIEEEWAWSRPFDYIHSRVMTGSINDWDLYLRRCHDNLVPGGWVELQELDVFATSDDGTLTEDHAILKWCKLLRGASEKLGRPYIDPKHLIDTLKSAGFVDVSMSAYNWPLNEWPKAEKYKQIGRLQLENGLSGIEGFTMAALTRAYDWSPDEVNVFIMDVRNEIKNKAIHAYTPTYCIIGRKPEREDSPAPPAPTSS